MDSTTSNRVWDTVELPSGAINCKWVFKMKRDSLCNDDNIRQGISPRYSHKRKELTIERHSLMFQTKIFLYHHGFSSPSWLRVTHDGCEKDHTQW